MTLYLLQDSGWWCPMCGGMDGAWGWGMMLFGWLFWIGLTVLVVWLVMRLTRGRDRSDGGPGGDRSEEILRERYARGEIDQETYERMLEDLRRR